MRGVRLLMKILKSLFFLSIVGLSSCYRISHQAYGTMYFSVSEIEKAELISALDSFANDNSMVKIQEGGERMLPEKMKVHVHAIYENSQEYQLAVQNFLNVYCYSVSTYDFENKDYKVAEDLSKKLKNRFQSVFNGRLTFYKDQYCGQAI